MSVPGDGRAGDRQPVSGQNETAGHSAWRDGLQHQSGGLGGLREGSLRCTYNTGFDAKRQAVWSRPLQNISSLLNLTRVWNGTFIL
jgi:hypothetical protein